MKNEEKKTKRPGLLAHLFGRKQVLDVFQEEGMESQWAAAAKRFFKVPLNVFALVVFVTIFGFMMIAPSFIDFEETYQEVTQQNISPGMNIMDYPKELEGNCKQISVGSTFSVGLSNDGKVYVWGKSKITNTIDVANLPDDIYDQGEILQVAAGYDHALALTSKGDIIVWGNTRLRQGEVPKALGRKKITQIGAGYQGSFAVTEDGRIYFWGNESVINFKAKDYQGRIKKASFCFTGIIALLDDGSVAALVSNRTGFSEVPSGNNYIDIAGTSYSGAALTDDGKIVPWGYRERGLDTPVDVSTINGKPVAIDGGRFHFTVLTDIGYIYSWGYNNFGQADAPDLTNVKEVYSGYFQNYAVGEDGKITTWGLSGYLLGSDGYGRDVLTRIIGGGRMTLTIGAIAVVISTFIGIVLGSISGYYGGKADIFIMRLQEVVSSIPFMPLAMILSVVIGSTMSENGRIVLIMVILGLLGWTSLCRLVRAQVLAEREKEYITAGRAMGVSEKALMFRHIFPNIISIILVNATLSFASCLLTEAGLSYLGFGVVEPKPTWGNMLNGANDSVVIQNYWWRWVFPAIVLGLCTICINIIGDGLRDAIDPKADRER